MGKGNEGLPLRGLKYALFFEASRLAAPVAQEIQFGPAHMRVPDHLNLVNTRRVKEEPSFHANSAGGNSAHGKGCVDAPPPHSNNHPLEYLNPFVFALNDSNVYFYRIANGQIRQVFF